MSRAIRGGLAADIEVACSCRAQQTEQHSFLYCHDYILMIATISHLFNINKEDSTLAGTEEVNILKLQLWLFDFHLLDHFVLYFLGRFNLDHVVTVKTPAFWCAF